MEQITKALGNPTVNNFAGYNRAERRRLEKKLKGLRKHTKIFDEFAEGDIRSLTASAAYNELPEEEKKKLLLGILEGVKKKNEEFEVMKNGDSTEAGNEDLASGQ